MFSNGNKILLFLTDKILAVYSEDAKLNDRIEFPSKVYSDLKIADREKFKELVVELLARTNLKKQKAIIALGETAVYMKTGEVKEETDAEVLTEQFENSIPFEIEKASKVEIADGLLKLIAANKEVYESIIEASRIFEWSIDAVVPVSAFGTTEREGMLTPDEVASLLGDAKEIKQADFLTKGDMKKKEPFREEEPHKTKYKLFLLVIPIIAVLCALFFARSFLNKLKTDGKGGDNFSLQSIALPSAAPATSPTASPSAQARSSVKIEVLNGTGTPGQAAQVQNLLEDLGYSDIAVGNAQTKTVDTILETSATFSATLKDEISSVLKKNFTSVSEQDLQDQNFDVVVVTGK